MEPKAPGGRSLRCFVGFFGITRGLDQVIDSIEQNIFDPLDRAGVRTVRAAHLNQPDVIRAPRSGEDNIAYKPDNLARLRLDHEQVEQQCDANISTELAEALSIPLLGENDTEGTARRNVVHQLYSLWRLGGIFGEYRAEHFDFAILARPDLRYLDPLPLRQLLAQLGVAGLPGLNSVRRGFKPAANLITPSWGQWGGLNDRFAVATPIGARAYMNRIRHLPQFCRAFPAFQSEALLRFAAERDGLRTATTWMRAERVRLNGSVAPWDRPGRRERLRRMIVHPLRRALRI